MDEIAAPSKGRAPQTREHSSSVWEGLRDQITQLHSVQGRPLDEVMDIIERQHGFVASVRQYKIKISEWHVGKNIKGTEYKFIAQTQAKRALEDKETNFRVRGRDVPPGKITRAVKRQKISEEELLAMPSAPTPSDISYGTPSVFDPQSPYVQQTVAQSPGPTFATSPNQLAAHSPWTASEMQSRAAFLVSQPATPLPVIRQRPNTPLEYTVFQSPPGMFQSPDKSWSTMPMNRLIAGGDAAANNSDACRIKYERLVELIRKTEDVQTLNYVETMSEVNSLVYDLVISDQQSSQNMGEEDSTLIAACYVCRALDAIGTDGMAAKVESERILLEAIAVSEGCFGEDHPGAYHFRVKLFFLYRGWSCRNTCCGGLLLQILSLAARKAPSSPASKILSDMIDSPNLFNLIKCPWLQYSSWELSVGISSYLFSLPSTQDFRTPNSPCRTWEVISAVADRFHSTYYNFIEALEPQINYIMQHGATYVDESLYFWAATFIAAFNYMWKTVFDAKTLIRKFIREDTSISKSIESSLKRFSKDPFRVELATVAKTVVEADSENAGISPLPRHDEQFERLLEELRLTLVELSLGELEISDSNHIFRDLAKFVKPKEMYRIVRSAAEFGNSTFITELCQCFGKLTFNYFGDTSFTDMLNRRGPLAHYDVDLPLHLAVSGGHLLTVEALLIAGADPDRLDGDENLAISLAAERDHDEIVRLLLRKGALVPPDHRVLRCTIKSSDYENQLREKFLQSLRLHTSINTSLLSVILIGELQRYELLDDISEIIREEVTRIRDNTERFGEPLLRFIVRNYSSGSWDKFLDVADDEGRGLELFLDVFTGVHIEQQARQILKEALFGSSTTMNENRLNAETSAPPPLHTLVLTNAINALGVFLDLESNLSLVDSQGNTALHVAADWNRPACARLLLRYKIDVDVVNNDGETALQVALRKRNTGVSNEIIMTLPLSI